MTWSANRCTFSIWYDRLEPTPARMAISGSANSISRTKLSCGGSILPELNMPMRCGYISTSRFCPGCTGRAQPPASTGRPSQWSSFHRDSGFSSEYMKHDLPRSN